MRRVEPLDSSHDRKSFDCGVIPLNIYLQQTARQHSEKDISRVYVLVEQNARAPKPVLGFFTLAACEAGSREMPEAIGRKLPYNIPAVRLGRLAVHKTMQGCGLGKDLMLVAMVKTAETARLVGATGLFVDAKDDLAACFYGRFGFQPLSGQPLTLFLPIQSLREIVEAAGLTPK